MGVDDFSSKWSGDSDKVRPYVSESTHEDVQEFASRSGLDISEAYDLIIQTVVSNDSILEDVLSQDAELQSELSETQQQLLDDIVCKWEDIGEFPDRQDINEDPDMNGFPIYIMALGPLSQIRTLAMEKYADRPRPQS